MPYRIPSRPDKALAPPAKHVYMPIHREALNSAAPGCIAFVPIGVGIIIAGLGFPIVALIGAIATGVGLWVFFKKNRNRGRVLFTCDDGYVMIQWLGSSMGDQLSLGELDDIVLDTKTIERIQDGSPMVPALQAINATVAPPTDTARIVLKTESRTVYLTEEFLSYTETADQIAKLRVFLRKHGWVPIDERE
jgi:hypothetical protein